MTLLFYGSALIAIIATIMTITRTNIVHALLYFVLSLIAIAVIFAMLNASLAAALQVIVYAGAIMVMYIIVMMMLNLGKETVDQEKSWLDPKLWIGPCILAFPLLAILMVIIKSNSVATVSHSVIEAKSVGIALFGPYVLAVELASLLLLAGLVGAYHLARK